MYKYTAMLTTRKSRDQRIMPRDPGRQPRHFIYALLDASQTVRYLGTGQHGSPAPWRVVWQHRGKLPSRLAAWLRTLDHEPAEQIVLGAAIGLHAATARMVTDMLRDWFPAAIREPRIVGGHGKGRAVSHVDRDGRVQVWRSRQEAADAAGISRPAIVQRLRSRPDWFDADLT
jgi:hypothetical protein